MTRRTPDQVARLTQEAQALKAAGKSHAEIGEVLGISRAYAGKLLRAAPPTPPTSHAPVVRDIQARKPERRVSAQVGGRVTIDSNNPVSLGANTVRAIIPPPDHTARWTEFGLDMKKWDQIPVSQLLDVLLSVSPEMSRATYDALRMLDPGHEIKAYKPGTDDPDERAQTVLDAFVAELEDIYGSFKHITMRLFMSALMRGAMFSELVIDEAGRKPVDLVVPDPITVRFRHAEHPVRGVVWEMGQWQRGEFVVFDQPTVRYMAIDPLPDSPYGRPMLTPAIFPSVFLIGLMHDLRRVVAQQGYPRTKLIVQLEKFSAAYEDLPPDEFDQKLADFLAYVSGEYSKLEPDDAFAFTDLLDVDQASGAVDSSVLTGAVHLIEALERMAMRASKSMPLTMGITDGVSEANANRQWEIQAAGVKSLQHLAERMLASHLTLALEVQGVQAIAKVEFAELRAAEELRDEQTRKIKIENAVAARDQGFIDQEEAAMLAVGHAPALALPPGDASAAPDDDEEARDRANENDEDLEGENARQRSFAVGPVEVTDDLFAEAVDAWDEVMMDKRPTYAGLLGASAEVAA